MVVVALGLAGSHALRLALVELLDAGLATLLLHLALEGRVEVVLYVVVGASGEVFRYLGPAVPILEVELEDARILLLSPSILLDIGVQMVVPALPALLADAARQVLSNLAPVLSAALLHLVDQLAILLFCPRPFHHFGVEHFLPSVEALHIRAGLEAFSDALPILGAHLLYKFFEFLVLQVWLANAQNRPKVILGTRFGRMNFLPRLPSSSASGS